MTNALTRDIVDPDLDRNDIILTYVYHRFFRPSGSLIALLVGNIFSICLTKVHCSSFDDICAVMTDYGILNKFWYQD